MSSIPPNKRAQAIAAAAYDSRIRLLPRRVREHMARDVVEWSCDLHDDGFNVPQIRKEVRKKAKQEYGSILVIIAFTIIWEIIKQWLFD